MARQGGMVGPRVQVFDLPGWVKPSGEEECGELTVSAEEVMIVLGSTEFVIDPNSAPLFRMIANRLDEISGKRSRS